MRVDQSGHEHLARAVLLASGGLTDVRGDGGDASVFNGDVHDSVQAVDGIDDVRAAQNSVKHDGLQRMPGVGCRVEIDHSLSPRRRQCGERRAILLKNLSIYIACDLCKNAASLNFSASGEDCALRGREARPETTTISPIRIRCLSMPTIRVKENEPFEVALRRFKRTIEKSGLLTELRAREFYEKPTAERKRKKAAAIKRHYKRLRSMMLPKKLY